MAIIKVSTSAQLVQALKSAHPGDTIALASGTYSGVAIKNLKFDGAVNITSQDPNNKAVLTDLLVQDSKGLNFSHLEFSMDPAKASNAFLTHRSENITYDRLHVHGSLNGDPSDDKTAMMVRDSSNVSVTNSEFEQLFHALAFLGGEHLNFSGNNFHDLRTDGIRGGGASHVLVANNTFTDFHPAKGDHPDAIQFWTTGTTAVAHDIVITGNVMTRGNGEVYQGIFLRDQLETLPFKNVTIANNTAEGLMYNGIAVLGAQDVTIKNNVVTQRSDQDSWIRVDNAIGVKVEGNTAPKYIYDAVQGLAPSGNITTGAVLGAIIAPIKAAAAPLLLKLDGTAGADRLNCSKAGDTEVFAGAGNDVITGGEGANRLNGGDGDDTFIIVDSNDLVIESANGGNDTVAASIDYVLTANVESLRLTGEAKIGVGNELNNKITGTAGDNVLSGMDGADQITGQEGDDTLYGGDGDDILYGNAGNDIVDGGVGADKLYGNEGDDQIFGGDGADHIEGGVGSDVLAGGRGADMFFFRAADVATGAGIDRVTDFSLAEGDRIALADIDANGLTTLNDKFAFIGTQAFHKIAGELRYEVQNGNATVYGDTNGDGVADFKIMVDSVSTLSASAFML